MNSLVFLYGLLGCRFSPTPPCFFPLSFPVLSCSVVFLALVCFSIVCPFWVKKVSGILSGVTSAVLNGLQGSIALSLQCCCCCCGPRFSWVYTTINDSINGIYSKVFGPLCFHAVPFFFVFTYPMQFTSGLATE